MYLDGKRHGIGGVGPADPVDSVQPNVEIPFNAQHHQRVTEDPLSKRLVQRQFSVRRLCQLRAERSGNLPRQFHEPPRGRATERLQESLGGAILLVCL